ncbi:MAG TPA: hypothetical protein VFP71_11260, partial [Candidatus Angelobacter sp.]|nr:hypothetical protein [Candidatus Angelobacter sp.]
FLLYLRPLDFFFEPDDFFELLDFFRAAINDSPSAMRRQEDARGWVLVRAGCVLPGRGSHSGRADDRSYYHEDGYENNK